MQWLEERTHLLAQVHVIFLNGDLRPKTRPASLKTAIKDIHSE